MKFRLMNKDDYIGMYDLWAHTAGMGLNMTDDSREGIERFLERNPTTCFVAEEDGMIVGVIMAGHDGRRGYIYHTAVHEHYRRNGIAKELVKRAVDALECEHISKVALVVFERNTLGNRFWEEMGFTVRDDLVYRNRNICDLVRIDT